MTIDQHVKTLGALYIGGGLFGGLTGVILLVVSGGFGGLRTAASQTNLAGGSASVIGFLATGVVATMLLLAVPSIVAGLGLRMLRPWARSFSMVLGVLHLANFPLGTMLALYSFSVMMAPQTERLFEPNPYRPTGRVHRMLSR